MNNFHLIALVKICDRSGMHGMGDMWENIDPETDKTLAVKVYKFTVE